MKKFALRLGVTLSAASLVIVAGVSSASARIADGGGTGGGGGMVGCTSGPDGKLTC